jgi:hypothetical protein
MWRHLRDIPLAGRLAIFLALWFLAGGIAALFSEIDIEAGQDEWPIQVAMTFLFPLFAAQSMAFVLVPGGEYAWPGRQTWETVCADIILGLFLLHAIATLSPMGRRRFPLFLATQALLVIVAVACVLYYYHWDMRHMHG